MRVQFTAARRRGSGSRRTKLTRKIEEFIGKYSATVDLQGDARRFVRLSELIYCFFPSDTRSEIISTGGNASKIE